MGPWATLPVVMVMVTMCAANNHHIIMIMEMWNLNKTSATTLAKTPSIKRTRKRKVGTNDEGDHHIENNHHIEKR